MFAPSAAKIVGRSRTWNHFISTTCLTPVQSSINTYTPPIPNRPSHNAPSISSRSNLQWENLGGVEPGDGEPGRSEDRGVQEYEKDGATTDVSFEGSGCVLGGVCQAAGAETADSLADGAPV